MNNKETYKEFVWHLMDVLRDAMLYREVEYSVVRLVFIKYAVDNYIGAYTVEDMQVCSRAQKMFSMRDVDNGIESLIPVLQYIDRAYDLSGVLANSHIIDSFNNLFYGLENSVQRKNATKEDFRDILRLLSSVDLEETDDEKSKGPMLVDALVDVIINSSYRRGYASEYTTKPQLSKLVSRILNVKSDDRYCDFSSGIGLSTLGILNDKNTEIKNADINPDAISISAMLLIMAGYKKLIIKCDDSLSQPIESFNGNKVFVDGPWGMKMINNPNYEYTDSSLAILDRCVENYMENTDDSVSVVTVPAGVLFQQKKQAVSLRKELLNRGLIKAVISLPPLKAGTLITVNLIVMTRKHNDRVLFINASDFQQQALRGDTYGDNVLPDTMIERIVNALELDAETDGFSRIVSIDEIAANEYNLIPTMFVRPIIEDDDTTLEEVNSQLDDLYKQLLGK